MLSHLIKVLELVHHRKHNRGEIWLKYPEKLLDLLGWAATR